MSKLDELRKRASKQREEREKAYVENIQKAVGNVLKSDNLLMMTALSNGGVSVLADEEKTKQVVTEIAKSVTATITNPVENFLSITVHRGFTKRRLKVAVAKIYDMYFTEFSRGDFENPIDVPYETKLEAVATKLELEPNLWDELGILRAEEGI